MTTSSIATGAAAAEELRALDQAYVLHPHAVVGHPLPPLVLVRGQGARVWDVDGNEYIDGTGGLWLNAVGHGREELAQAGRRADAATGVLRVVR